MSAEPYISLRLGHAQLDALCRRLLSHSTRAEQALAGLVALQSLLALSAEPATQASNDYHTLKGLLDDYTEQARQRLLEESASRLATALAAQDCAAIAALYGPLSRSGFAAILEQALERLNAAQLQALAQWVRHWLGDARTRGEAASGCPDAIDFAGANIDVLEFNAMSDMLLGIERTG